MKRLLPIAVLCSLATSVGAVDMKVLGFQLGTRIALPECKVSSHVYISPRLPNYKLYADKQKTTCIDEQRSPQKGKFGTRSIRLSEADTPQTVKGAQLGAFDSDGILVGISMSTYGVINQQFDLNQLTVKYGKPTRLSTTTVQNPFGARYEIIHARWWDLDGLSVSFDGSIGLLDEGLIVIDTQEATIGRAELQKLAKPMGKQL